MVGLSSGEQSVVAAGLGGHLEGGGVLGFQGLEGLGELRLSRVLSLGVLSFLEGGRE